MKIGLITYHSAYNFGSVLQAFATLKIINDIKGDCTIINYRTKEQRRIYSIFPWNKGVLFFKSVIKNMILLPKYKLRVLRQSKYEDFFRKYFELTEELIEPEDVYGIWNRFDTIVSGSDQIWNKHSNELDKVDWKYMMPYLLHGYDGYKISYASSVVNMTDSELEYIMKDVQIFDSISIRERSACDFLNVKYNLNAKNVLDPTLLLSKEQWERYLPIKENNEDYILYYALDSFKNIKKSLSIIKKYGLTLNKKIKVIAPMTFVTSDRDIQFIYDAGPIDFLELINNANFIITDSYHGTLFSINFQKEFVSICRNNPSDGRKVEILSKLGLADRIVSDVSEVFKFSQDNLINYDLVAEKKKRYVEDSISYIRKALR